MGCSKNEWKLILNGPITTTGWEERETGIFLVGYNGGIYHGLISTSFLTYILRCDVTMLQPHDQQVEDEGDRERESDDAADSRQTGSRCLSPISCMLRMSYCPTVWVADKRGTSRDGILRGAAQKKKGRPAVWSNVIYLSLCYVLCVMY